MSFYLFIWSRFDTQCPLECIVDYGVGCEGECDVDCCMHCLTNSILQLFNHVLSLVVVEITFWI